MATNQLLPFGMGDSPNRIPFADWNTLPARLTGFQSGIASSQQFNYILAQGGLAGYLLGQMIVEFAQQDATLDNAEAMYTALKNAVAAFVPNNIADKSILTAKIADLAITTAKIADEAVTAEKLAEAAVTAAKILDGAVGTDALADGAVTNVKLAAGTITFDRLASAAIATKEEAEAPAEEAPAEPEAIKHAENEFVFLVEANYKVYKGMMKRQRKTCTLTIPAALYTAAKESGINMSQVFQDALREQLGLS